MDMRLDLVGVACGYGRHTILHDINFSLETGENLCLLGPNGVGKTTLFRTILGLMPPHAGTISVDGIDLCGHSRRSRAQVMAYVPQAHTPPFPFRAMDVVLTGRTPHTGAFRAPSRSDRRLAEESLADLGAEDLAERTYTELSGGERQLVLIARALAQKPKVLVMDEPSTSLDFGNQARLLDLIARLVKDRGLAVLMSSHFPNQAFACASKVALIKDGRLLATGSPVSTMTEENLQATYGVPVRILERSNGDGTPLRLCAPCLN